MKRNLNFKARFVIIFNYLTIFHCFNWLSDKSYLRLSYRIHMGRKLDLNNPKSLTEKIQWLKLYNRNPLYTTLADKCSVKLWVKEKIGKDITIPTLGVWSRFEDIDFSNLPEQFVLKTTHDSGGVKIIKEKSNVNYESLKKWFNRRLKKNMFFWGREFVYKDITPRIIAEPYMEDKKYGELRDYKFFCFGGTPRIMYVATERQKGEAKFDFFDMKYNHLNLLNGHPNATIQPEKPESFELMKEYAAILSKDFPFVRVDFYEINDVPYLGEMTFYHMCGFLGFTPDEWDYKMGEWLVLPEFQ